jgi:hypothetical protein
VATVPAPFQLTRQMVSGREAAARLLGEHARV